jgi:hypothetical protein
MDEFDDNFGIEIVVSTGESEKSGLEKAAEEAAAANDVDDEKDSNGSNSDEQGIPPSNEDAEEALSNEEDGKSDQEGVADQGENAQSDSPQDLNIYSSIAQALKEDGILTLEDSDLNIKDANDLASAFMKQVEKLTEEKFDETQKKINEALTAGVPNDEIAQFENMIKYLKSVDGAAIEEESSESEELRKNIIYQDFVNKGFSEEKATKMMQKSIDAGTDIEDAKEALDELKKFYQTSYDARINEAKKATEEKKKREIEFSKAIETKIMENEEPVQGIKLGPVERKAILSQFKTFVDKSGNVPMNAIGKYAKENPIDFQYNMNVLFYLTNGFKDLSKVVNKEVTKAKKTALDNIGRVLKNPNTSGFGTSTGLNFGNDKSKESRELIVALD